MSEKFKNKEEIEEFCKRIFGDCKDGSYQACLYYNLKKFEKEEKENENDK